MEPVEEDGVTFTFVESALMQSQTTPRRKLELSQILQAWVDSLWGYSTSVGVKGKRPVILDQADAELSDFQQFLEACLPEAEHLQVRAMEQSTGFTKFRDSRIDLDEINNHVGELTRLVLEAHMMRLKVAARRQPIADLERKVQSARGYGGPNAAWGGFPTPEMELVRQVYEKQLESAFQAVYRQADEIASSLNNLRQHCIEGIQDVEDLWTTTCSHC